MSRYFWLRTGCFGAVVLGVIFSGGCERLGGDASFYEMTVPRERVREVEKLDLEQMKPDAKAEPNAGQGSPKEMELRLEDCRAMALGNNLDLKVELINPAIAAQRVSEEESRFEAAFFSNINYSKTDTPTSTTLEGSRVDMSNTDLGVQMPLRTGGTLTFDLADRRVKTNNIFSTLNPSYSSAASFSISQPLLRNAGQRANTHAIRIAEYGRLISETRTKLEVIRVLAACDRVYWRLYAARKELAVRKQQYDLAKALLEQARRFVDAGERSQVEIIRAEAGAAERLEGIIIAEKNVRDRERELKQILNKSGLGMQTGTVLVCTTEPDPVHYFLSGERVVVTAIEQRMEMLELELELAQDMSTIDFQRNQALPLVTLDYTYNINGLGATQGDSYDVLFDKQFEDNRFGLKLLVPLGNSAARSRVLQAFYQRQQRLAAREGRKMAIEVEVLSALDQLEANWQRILASRQSTILAGRLLEAEQRQFEVGLRTSTDVLDAQSKLGEAERAEIQALAEYEIARVDLAYATGTVLGAAKVQWEPIVPGKKGG